MLGMPSPVALEEPAALTSGKEQPVPAASPEKKRALMGTMIGMPSPVLPETKPTAAPQRTSSSGKFGGTLLGIAQPGIAPNEDYTKRPNVAAPPSAAPPRLAASAAQSRPARQSTPASVPMGLPHKPPATFPTTRPTWHYVLLAIGGLIVAASIGGLAALLGPQRATLKVDKFTIDNQGNDELSISCDECLDGTTISLGKIISHTKDGTAIVHPSSPLKLGKNTLNFRVSAPGGDVLRAKALVLPVAFRVQTDWDGRHEKVPFAAVTVAAPDDSTVQIAGTPFRLKDKRAVYRKTFGQAAQGEESKVLPLAFVVPIVVTVNGIKRETSASLTGAIAPLTLTSPAPLHQLNGKSVTVAGRTSPDATVMVGSTKVSAGANGTFSHTIDSPKEGELEVRAYTDRLVARRLRLKFVTQANVPTDAVRKFKDIQPGLSVTLVGNVLESRVKNGTTTALLEVQTGCENPPCLLRAVYGAPIALKPNRQVRVFGTAASGSSKTLRVTRFH